MKSAGVYVFCVNGLGTHMTFVPATHGDMHFFEQEGESALGRKSKRPSAAPLAQGSLRAGHVGTAPLAVPVVDA